MNPWSTHQNSVYSSVCHCRGWFCGCVLGPCTKRCSASAHPGTQGTPRASDGLDTEKGGAHIAEILKLPCAFLHNILRKSVNLGNRKSLPLQTGIWAGSSTQFCVPRTYHDGGWCGDGAIRYHQVTLGTIMYHQG